MRDFTKRRGQDVTRLLLRFAGLLVLFFVTTLVVRAGWGMYGKFSEAAQSSAEAEANLADLQSQEAQVNASVEALQSDRGIEAQIRQTYGVAKPGEGEIQIVRDATTTTTTAPPEPSFFGRVWQALFGWL